MDKDVDNWKLIDFSTIQTMGSGASVSATARKRGVASVSVVTLLGSLWKCNCFSITENMGSGASVSETARKKTDKRQLIGKTKKRN